MTVPEGRYLGLRNTGVYFSFAVVDALSSGPKFVNAKGRNLLHIPLQASKLKKTQMLHGCLEGIWEEFGPFHGVGLKQPEYSPRDPDFHPEKQFLFRALLAWLEDHASELRLWKYADWGHVTSKLPLGIAERLVGRSARHWKWNTAEAVLSALRFVEDPGEWKAIGQEELNRRVVMGRRWQ